MSSAITAYKHGRRRLPVTKTLSILVLCFLAVVGNSQTSDTSHAKRRVLYAPPPKYPFVARARHWTGAVPFACNLSADGTVASVSVLRSTGHNELDDAAMS